MSRPDRDAHSAPTMITRRSLVNVGGATLVSVTVLGLGGCASAAQKLGMPLFPRAEPGPIAPLTVAGVPVGTLNGGSKPIYVAPPGSMDPVAHSIADTLFWGDIMMEHAKFFAMLMPGAELASQRAEAERFQRQFDDHLARLRAGRVGRGDYVAQNNRTLGLVNAIIGFKQRMEAAQTSGAMRSLVWPSFFDHTRKEAERFARRLVQLNGGNPAFDRREVVPFWADKMEEHALFVNDLLDPDETVLKEVAETAAGQFAQLERAPVGSKDAALAAAQTIIDFKTAAAKGISAGKIKSIIHPALADHVRREAVRFKDELMRAA